MEMPGTQPYRLKAGSWNTHTGHAHDYTKTLPPLWPIMMIYIPYRPSYNK